MPQNIIKVYIVGHFSDNFKIIKSVSILYNSTYFLYYDPSFINEIPDFFHYSHKQVFNEKTTSFESFLEQANIIETDSIKLYFSENIKILEAFFGRDIFYFFKKNYSYSYKDYIIQENNRIRGKFVHLNKLILLNDQCDFYSNEINMNAIEKLTELKNITENRINFLKRICDRTKLNNIYYEDEDYNTPGKIAKVLLYNYLLNAFEKKQEGLSQRILTVDKNWSVSKFYSQNKKASKISGPISGASFNSYYYLCKNSSGVINCLLHGGRTCNEQAHKNYYTNVLDADLISCYPSILKKFNYVIGKPRIYSFITDNKKTITLQEFLDKYEDDLLENSYQILISGSLTFNQTLLYSKIIREIKLESEDSNSFVLLEKELENCLITSEIYKVLKKICSTKELKEILDCQVVTATFFLRSDKKTYVDFVETLEEKNIENYYNYDTDSNSIIDNRPYCWVDIGLFDLIDPLIQLRNELKKNSDLENEKTLKLIINSIYGVICSKNYHTNNIILANNITAYSRLYIWLASRCLKGIQTITDGITFETHDILKIKKESAKKPSLASLSNLRTLYKHRNIEKISLDNKNWDDYFYKKIPFDYVEINLGLQTHIVHFWKHYGVVFELEFKIKEEHTAIRFFAIKKGHYSGLTPDGYIYHKYRGISQNKTISHQRHPFFEMSEEYLCDKKKEINTLITTEERTCTVTKFLKDGEKEHQIFPGESYPEDKTFKLDGSEFPVNTKMEWSKRVKKDKDFAKEFIDTQLTVDEILMKRSNLFQKKEDVPPPPKNQKKGGSGHEKKPLNLLKNMASRKK